MFPPRFIVFLRDSNVVIKILIGVGGRFRGNVRG